MPNTEKSFKAKSCISTYLRRLGARWSRLLPCLPRSPKILQIQKQRQLLLSLAILSP